MKNVCVAPLAQALIYTLSESFFIGFSTQRNVVGGIASTTAMTEWRRRQLVSSSPSLKITSMLLDVRQEGRLGFRPFGHIGTVLQEMWVQHGWESYWLNQMHYQEASGHPHAYL